MLNNTMNREEKKVIIVNFHNYCPKSAVSSPNATLWYSLSCCALCSSLSPLQRAVSRQCRFGGTSRMVLFCTWVGIRTCFWQFRTEAATPSTFLTLLGSTLFANPVSMNRLSSGATAVTNASSRSRSWS